MVASITKEKIKEQRFLGNLVKNLKNYRDYWPNLPGDVDLDSSDSDEEGGDDGPPVTASPVIAL